MSLWYMKMSWCLTGPMRQSGSDWKRMPFYRWYRLCRMTEVQRLWKKLPMNILTKSWKVCTTRPAYPSLSMLLCMRMNRLRLFSIQSRKNRLSLNLWRKKQRSQDPPVVVHITVLWSFWILQNLRQSTGMMTPVRRKKIIHIEIIQIYSLKN